MSAGGRRVSVKGTKARALLVDYTTCCALTEGRDKRPCEVKEPCRHLRFLSEN